ncbi:GNAT family N-acetyltransferase [Phenylobacterium sp.]|uniref:GNAT family N-acetyltransferase n=1 Tax=Phenylobacterium sp. TaxID=1871053 RepID=UPI002734872F|nr:GNAT family N-acetyltransferase [Phenylobacterium sp.]MDP3853585.1 GNAT family N-acetyltransferase [Phenylobacterium sp.]
MSLTVRLAGPADLAAAITMDAVATHDAHRRDWLTRAFNGETGRVARLAFLDGQPAGFAVVGDFFSNPFLDLIVTAPAARRQGVASALMAEIERVHAGLKLFVSTNVSNTVMQDLLARRGYLPSGRVDNLDPGDPELFYVRLPAPQRRLSMAKV